MTFFWRLFDEKVKPKSIDKVCLMLHVSCFVFHVSYLYAVLNNSLEMMCKSLLLGCLCRWIKRLLCDVITRDHSTYTKLEYTLITRNLSFVRNRTWNTHLLQETFHLYAYTREYRNWLAPVIYNTFSLGECLESVVRGDVGMNGVGQLLDY